MLFYDVIAKKRDGGRLNAGEIDCFVQGCVSGEVPDYQLSALLMAIYLRGMDAEETARLTLAMARSGDMIDLSSIPGVKVDKHSTGGVGDKTSLIVAPLVAACGAPVAKMSGRGLGHTGGTVDKLESIPGFRIELPQAEFLAQVREIGLALAGQSGQLAPADKKLYALRDVTATVGCLPLIASSVMSKKLAAGSDAILLDVKTGRGALIADYEGSLELARQMVAIGQANGRRTAALITDMNTPLGQAVGNSLEVAECVRLLAGDGPEDLRTVCLELAAGMLELAGKGSLAECRRLAGAALQNGSALEKFRQLVAAQGGEVRYIDEPSLFPAAPFRLDIPAAESGYITSMEAAQVGMASVLLGAGRQKKEDAIDHAAGILLHKKTGDRVEQGQPIASLLCQSEAAARQAEGLLAGAVRIGAQPPAALPLLYARVDEHGVTPLGAQ